MTAYKGRDLTAAIVSDLTTAGALVGQGDKPAGGGWQGTPGASVFVAYVVVHPTPGGVFDGSLDEPFDDAQPDYIISSFAATQVACQELADVVFARMLSAVLPLTERRVQLVIPDVEGGVVRDDDVQPPVFYSPTRWRIFTTSS